VVLRTLRLGDGQSRDQQWILARDDWRRSGLDGNEARSRQRWGEPNERVEVFDRPGAVGHIGRDIGPVVMRVVVPFTVQERREHQPEEQEHQPQPPQVPTVGARHGAKS
jgi:hypothetical protein